jgi:serine/threonine-protein kinase
MTDDTLSPAVHARALARVGTVLKQKWRLRRLLGVGGMAAVYAGTHRTGYSVAVKVLHIELSIFEEVRSRFAREPYVANQIKHPGVVRVLDDDVAEDGAAFIVMELLDGETLDDLWRRRGGRLPLDEALSIVARLLDVLAAAHEIGIVHRDIKPQNIFITSDGALKLLDFGIARVAEGSSTLTQAGGMLGTPAFMSPEQARGRWQVVDARSDLWSVGATLFVLISGHFVHEAETIAELHIAAATTPARSIAEVVPELPAEFVRLIARALSYDQADRWSDAQAMRGAVREIIRANAQVRPGSRSNPASHALSVGPNGTVVIGNVIPAVQSSVGPRTAPVGASDGAVPRQAGGVITVLEMARFVGKNRGLQDAWYASNGVTTVGPVTLDLFERGVSAGKVPDGCKVRHQSWSEWCLLQVGGEPRLKSAFDSTNLRATSKVQHKIGGAVLTAQEAEPGRSGLDLSTKFLAIRPEAHLFDDIEEIEPDEVPEDTVTELLDASAGSFAAPVVPITKHAVSRQVSAVSLGASRVARAFSIVVVGCAIVGAGLFLGLRGKQSEVRWGGGVVDSSAKASGTGVPAEVIDDAGGLFVGVDATDSVDAADDGSTSLDAAGVGPGSLGVTPPTASTVVVGASKSLGPSDSGEFDNPYKYGRARSSVRSGGDRSGSRPADGPASSPGGSASLPSSKPKNDPKDERKF